ncbi:MAG: L-threonylcarbamoyladenylate synthase [Pseudomonadota bacterium]
MTEHLDTAEVPFSDAVAEGLAEGLALGDVGSVAAVEIRAAAARLQQGGLVAFPTETVYGLGADARSDAAVARIYATKGRPAFNPLIVHVAREDAVDAIVEMNAAARTLAAAFWPGPLTLVLPARPDAELSLLATAGLATCAVRVPAHPVARALLTAAGCPVAAPSANPSGRLSPTTAAHVRDGFAETDEVLVLDGGAAESGLESTIVDVTRDRPIILRPGTVTAEMLADVLGTPVETQADMQGVEGAADVRPSTGGSDAMERPVAPGQLASHYAPRVPVRLDVQEVRSGEGLLAFGPDLPASLGPVRNLSVRGDLTEAAARLFTCLHALDKEDISGIAVMPIPGNGIGVALRDRLRRAAAPRDVAEGEE